MTATAEMTEIEEWTRAAEMIEIEGTLKTVVGRRRQLVGEMTRVGLLSARDIAPNPGTVQQAHETEAVIEEVGGLIVSSVVTDRGIDPTEEGSEGTSHHGHEARDATNSGGTETGARHAGTMTINVMELLLRKLRLPSRIRKQSSASARRSSGK